MKDAGPSSFRITSCENQIQFCGDLGEPKYWEPAGGDARSADFSALQECGEYVFEIPEYSIRLPIRIQVSPWDEIGRALIKAFYFQRASIEIESEYAGVYARALGHADTEVFVHSSAQSNSRPEGFKVSAPKGWYDAGDYNKYIVNSGISVWTLLTLYQCFPEYCRNIHLNIPESGKEIPDILAEVKWNLDWMLAMQDPDDGGVYHKLTNLRFDGMVMPSQCQNPRFVVMKTTAASLHFAAVMAQASRVFQPLLPQYAMQCLAQAELAWEWFTHNPYIPYRQPEDVRTGRYEDEHLDDEKQWAAIELFLATGNPRYDEYARSLKGVAYGVPVWQSVGTLGMISMALWKKEEQAQQIILGLADDLLGRQAKNAYCTSMVHADYVWGSNGMAANQGLVLLVAHLINADPKYCEGAVHMMDYLVGCNPLAQSFVTGFGDHPPLHPHHRLSEADGVPEPIPGFLVGGPNFGRQDARNCPPYESGSSSLAYLDHLGSYATNEVAINWNAPAAFLAIGLQSLYCSKYSPSR